MSNIIEDFYYGNIEPQEANSELSPYIEFSTTSNADSFISGFRFGAKFTYDTFVKNTKG